MLPSKKKKCKGNFRSGHYKGCGEEKYIKLYGLCSSCVSDWMNDNDLGKLYLQKMTITAKKKVQREDDKKSKEETKKAKIDLMSSDQYRSKYLQVVINKIARLIDFGQPCIATGNYGKMAGGHFYSVGSNRTICLNLHNIHIQSFKSNSWNGGDERRYAIGLEKNYSKDYLDFVISLKQTPVLKMSKKQMTDVYPIALKIANELDKNSLVRTTNERIELRNKVNYKLGIYEDKYCFF